MAISRHCPCTSYIKLMESEIYVNLQTWIFDKPIILLCLPLKNDIDGIMLVCFNYKTEKNDEIYTQRIYCYTQSICFKTFFFVCYMVYTRPRG